MTAEQERGGGIENARASAQAAFRAGRAAGRLEAIQALVDLMDETPDQAVKDRLYDAAERIQRLAKPDPARPETGPESKRPA